MAVRVAEVEPVEEGRAKPVEVCDLVHHGKLGIHKNVILRREALGVAQHRVVGFEGVRRHDLRHLVVVLAVEGQVLQVHRLQQQRLANQLEAREHSCFVT